MAAAAAEQVNIDNFKISAGWISRFKQLCGIVTRKITKFIPPSYTSDQAIHRANADAFVEAVKPRLAAFGLENTYNFDQSGFSLECHSGRTLRMKGNVMNSWFS